MIQPSAFLALEASLSLRLTSSFEALTSKVYAGVQDAISRSAWEEAENLILKLDLSSVFTANEEYIRYISKLSLLFGASRVTSTPGTSAVGLGFENDAVTQWVDSFRLSIQYNIQEGVIAKGLQLIANAKAEASTDPTFSVILKGEGAYLGSVLKADKPSAMLPFASFMGKDGKARFNLASSLHTSRLSAFGYTAEAEYLGITTYQINEQLDGRTCPVCSLMHGKIFNVSDARTLLDVAMRTQDPDELKTLQAWPSQNAQAVKDMAQMSQKDLVSRGWHVPPFHPGCRGLLAKVGRAPSIAAGKTVEEAPTYVATVSDFQHLGINLTQSKVNLWNSLMQTSPAEVVAKLTDTTPDLLLAGILGKDNPLEILGLSTLSVTQNGVNVELLKSVFGSKHPVKQDYYFRKNQSLYVGSIEVHPEDVDVVKPVLRNLYSTAKDTTMTSIQMVADDDISGYAWAKYGFSLSPKQWGLLRAQITKSTSKMGLVSKASAAEQQAVDALLSSPDPKSVFALSDLKLGRALLDSTTWSGELAFNDIESITRFLTALGK